MPARATTVKTDSSPLLHIMAISLHSLEYALSEFHIRQVF
jgi:hypothetical protein